MRSQYYRTPFVPFIMFVLVLFLCIKGSVKRFLYTVMSGWFPADRRTKAFRLYDKARWSVGSALASIAANKFLDWYNRPSSSAMAPPRLLRRNRMAYRPRRVGRSRRGFRRMSRFRRRRRGARVTMAAGKGPYQKRYPRLIHRPLNTDMTRNQYDSCRDLKDYSTISANTSSNQTTNVNFSVYDGEVAATKLFGYTDYKVKDVQLVLTPLNIHLGATDVQVTTNGKPFIYIIPKIHSTSVTGLTTSEVERLPGVMKFPIASRKKIVVNLATFGSLEEEVETSASAGAETVETPFKYIGFVHNPQTSGPPTASNYPKYGNAIIYVPQMASGSFLPVWKVQFLWTTIFKGNRSLIAI